MANFRKFKDLRIDLNGIYAYDTHIANNRSSGYHDTIYFYPKTARKDVIYAYYYCGKDEAQFEEDLKSLDDLFSIKSDEENKILP